jgi:transposase InsO family protein
MTRSALEEYASAVRRRYKGADKAKKTRILDEFCQTTGMHRKAAVRLLNRQTRPRSAGRGRPKRYGSELLKVLVAVWEVSDRLCGKLLKPVMPDLLLSLERHGELTVSEEVRAQLQTISAASIDRLLRIHKRDAVRQPHRKPPHPSSLKGQVPVRTWSEWSGVQPGSVQADLVLHCGESTEGFYLTTLCVIDVASGWTELEAVWGLGQHRVTAAIHQARRRLPFELQALHTDNGSEFINQTLFGYCRREQISFTRGRSYRKNDQAYVEQRNYLAVRRLVGHDRLTSKDAQKLLQQLYGLLRLQLNFLRPVRKLVSKQRLGARVVKHYDQPRTPYQRLVVSGCLSADALQDLAQVLDRTNPAELQRRIASTLHQLWRLGRQEGNLERKLG